MAGNEINLTLKIFQGEVIIEEANEKDFLMSDKKALNPLVL